MSDCTQENSNSCAPSVESVTIPGAIWADTLVIDVSKPAAEMGTNPECKHFFSNSALNYRHADKTNIQAEPTMLSPQHQFVLQKTV